MARVLLAEAPDPEALVLLLQLVADDTESHEAAFGQARRLGRDGRPEVRRAGGRRSARPGRAVPRAGELRLDAPHRRSGRTRSHRPRAHHHPPRARGAARSVRGLRADRRLAPPAHPRRPAAGAARPGDGARAHRRPGRLGGPQTRGRVARPDRRYPARVGHGSRARGSGLEPPPERGVDGGCRATSRRPGWWLSAFWRWWATPRRPSRRASSARAGCANATRSTRGGRSRRSGGPSPRPLRWPRVSGATRPGSVNGSRRHSHRRRGRAAPLPKRPSPWSTPSHDCPRGTVGCAPCSPPLLAPSAPSCWCRCA